MDLLRIQREVLYRMGWREILIRNSLPIGVFYALTYNDDSPQMPYPALMSHWNWGTLKFSTNWDSHVLSSILWYRCRTEERYGVRQLLCRGPAETFTDILFLSGYHRLHKVNDYRWDENKELTCCSENKKEVTGIDACHFVEANGTLLITRITTHFVFPL